MAVRAFVSSAPRPSRSEASAAVLKSSFCANLIGTACRLSDVRSVPVQHGATVYMHCSQGSATTALHAGTGIVSRTLVLLWHVGG